MSNVNTAVKPKRKTRSFASRLLDKQLEERAKKVSFEFAKPVVQEQEEENQSEQKAN